MAILKAKSGIHIKPENKGKFTATKKKTGKSTEELTHSSNPVTKKSAIFAQNAKKWKHKDGGSLRTEINKRDMLPPSSKSRKQGLLKTKASVSPEKARKILHDGTIHGKPITDKQRRYFGAMSNKLQDGGAIQRQSFDT